MSRVNRWISFVLESDDEELDLNFECMVWSDVSSFASQCFGCKISNCVDITWL